MTSAAGAAERRAQLLARLREVGVLSVADLARELRVSPMTVRRDLHLLEEAGRVRTVHGGVGLAGATPATADGDTDARRRVALRAAALVDGGETLALDAGPLAHELARALPDDFTGTVITHSMTVMALLAERARGAAGPKLVALGGELLPARQALVGPTTLDAIAGLRARTFFLDAAAVDLRGTYARSTGEARVARSLADIADRVVLLATAETLGGSAPALVARLDRLAAVVTDRPLPAGLAAALTRAGVMMHVAG